MQPCSKKSTPFVFHFNDGKKIVNTKKEILRQEGVKVKKTDGISCSFAGTQEMTVEEKIDFDENKESKGPGLR